MSFNVKEVILYFFVPVWIVAEALIVIWMFKAKPDNNIRDKYPRKIIILSQLPFGKRWRKDIEKKDLTLTSNLSA